MVGVSCGGGVGVGRGAWEDCGEQQGEWAIYFLRNFGSQPNFTRPRCWQDLLLGCASKVRPHLVQCWVYCQNTIVQWWSFSSTQLWDKILVNNKTSCIEASHSNISKISLAFISCVPDNAKHIEWRGVKNTGSRLRTHFLALSEEVYCDYCDLELNAQIFSTKKLFFNHVLGFLSTVGFARSSAEWRVTRKALTQQQHTALIILYIYF